MDSANPAWASHGTSARFISCVQISTVTAIFTGVRTSCLAKKPGARMRTAVRANSPAP